MAKFESQSSYDNHVKNRICNNTKDSNQTSSEKRTTYFCSDCNKYFKWKQSFYKHRKKQHSKSTGDENFDEGDKKLEDENREEIIVYYISDSDKTEHDSRVTDDTKAM